MKNLFKLVIILSIILGIFCVQPNLVSAAAPEDPVYEGAGSVSGTNTVTYNGVTYSTDNDSTVAIGGCDTLCFNYLNAGSLYSGNAMTNDGLFSMMKPTFFQISSQYLDNFNFNTMYYIATDYGDGHVINIEGREGGKNGDVVAYAYNIDMSTTGSYGTGNNSVNLVNEINASGDAGYWEYGGILTFGSNWRDIDTILITNAEGDTKAVYAVVDSLDFSNVVDVSVNDVTVNEGSGNATFTISLSDTYGSAVTVDYATANNTATTDDYTSSSGTKTIPVGATSTTVTVPINKDTMDEENESFYLNISNPSVGGITYSKGVGTITDDDAEPYISINDATVAEGNSGTTNLVFTVSLTQASGKTVSLDFATADGTATIANNDYTAITTTMLFAPGETSKTITVAAKGDTTSEANEVFFVNLTNVSNANVSDVQGSGTITDDDIPSLSINDVSVIEGNSGTTNLQFSVNLSSPSHNTITVNYATSSGTATTGTDYITGSGTITFAPGETFYTITILTKADSIDEEDETLYVNLSGATSGIMITDAQGMGTIIDDDPQPSMSITDIAVTEGDSGTIDAEFTVTLSTVSSRTVMVNYATQDGTATLSNNDYIESSGTITFVPGETSKNITVQILGDTIYEPDRNFSVNLSGASYATLSKSSASGTITDDDPAPHVTLSSDKTSISEALVDDAVTLTATLSNKSFQDVTVSFGLTGTAIAGIDYSVTPAGSPIQVVIPAGSLSGTLTLTVLNDADYEENETLSVDIVSVTNGTEDGEQKVDLSVADNETVPSVTLSVSPITLSENIGTATVTAILSRKSYQDVTVNLNFTGTATGTDYTASSITITIPAGNVSGSMTLTGNNNAVYEGNRTVIVDIGSVTNGTENGTQQAITTITDDDPAPSVTLSIVDSTLEENGGVATIKATLSALSSMNTTVELSFSGTATTTDYGKSLSGVITIPAGSLSGTLSLTSIDDATDEDNETIIVKISNIIGATENGTQQVTATITDDDAEPTISINSPLVLEGETGTANLVYTVTLSQASGKTVIVDCATQDGTATTADSDYVATTSTLTFATGETIKTITITVNGDTVLEANETVLVKLSNPMNATISAGQDIGTGTITNDDIPVIEVYGNGVKINNNDTTPSIIDYTDFGSIKVVGESVIREFTISNSGNTTLVLSGTSPYITISGANATDFSVVTGPAISINSGETNSFFVKFDPSSAGIKNARITIANNDNSNNPFVFDMKGVGTTPTPTPTSNETPTSTTTQSNNKIDVIFGDNTLKAAIAKVSEKDGTKTTVVTLDDAAVNENLDHMSKDEPNRDKAITITIPVNNNSDIVVGQLNGQTVKSMQDKKAILEIRTESVIYTIPAEDINIDSVSEKIGGQVQLKDITVQISVLKSSKETISKVENSARTNNLQIVVNPVDFKITCTNGSKTVDVSKFNNYVGRTVILPDGIDHKKITTCVVLNNDGTFSHVPTAVKLVEGKYYAKINSLTNSTYTLIWNPVTFKDAEKHWSKNYVNSVGSRLIDEGVGNSKFAPNRAITRAEFASMVVKALGLKGSNFPNEFKDVKESNPNYYYIYTAYEYGIMDGYSNGNFGPQDLITREQAMTMLVKAMDIAGMDVKISKTDIRNQLKRYKDSNKISLTARQTATICVKNGIFVGDKKGNLNPKGNLTRGESATVIIRLLKKAGLI